MQNMYENNLDPMDTAAQGNPAQDVQQPTPTPDVPQTAYSDQPSHADNTGQVDQKQLEIMKQPFEPATNKTDAASLQNVTSAADALSQMDEQQRAQAWPRIASGLIKDNPKLATMISIDKVPDQDQIDTVLNKNGKSLYPKVTSEEEEEEEQTDEQKDSSDGEHNFAQLGQSSQNKVVKDLDELNTQIMDLDQVARTFNPDDFKSVNRVKMEANRYDEKLEINSFSKEDREKYASMRARLNNIDRIALNYRKLMTGVAGSDKEMANIRKVFLSSDMSATEAKYELKNLMTKFRRDAEVKRNLLSRGVLVDNLPQKEYTALFTQERQKVESDMRDYLKDLRMEYPQYKGKIDQEFAYKHKQYWEAQQKQTQNPQQQQPQGGQ